ncbi:MAG: hypothetical protein HAW63_04020 [Bdellovibrionaceae bacterium]|nr:hypothetical protein [Pseudobdellovibrionaceae bacterium]
MNFLFLLLFLLILNPQHSKAQLPLKGTWYGSYGWNKSEYKKSTIHFKGTGHNFTLFDVIANDRQTPVNFSSIFKTYFHPFRWSIPQYNISFGYFFTNQFAISIGFDHMKYVLQNNQTAKMSGHINPSLSETHQKELSSGTIDKIITTDFLTYEHTDGLNMLFIEAQYFYSIYSGKYNFDVSVFAGGGGGIALPVSNIQLLGKKRSDRLHIAGFGVSVKTGLEFTIWKDYFFRTTAKAGYINLLDVLTSYDGDKAKQKINYLEYIGVFGIRF